MKKVIIMFLAAMSVSLISYAQVAEQSDISNSERGRLVLQHKQEKDSIAAMDKIVLIKEKDSVVIFESEGRAIQQVLEEDLDGDKIPELLVQMDLGGSGGFKEFALLKFENGTYKQVWEETGYAAGEASIAARDNDGNFKLYIEYTDTEVEPAKEATAVFGFADGEFKQISQ